MTTTDSILAAAEHLLRRDAEELRESSTSSRDRDDWTGEEEAKADYDNHIAVADALASLSTEAAALPPSYFGGSLVSNATTGECVVRMHFGNAKEAERWFDAATDSREAAPKAAPAPAAQQWDAEVLLIAAVDEWFAKNTGLGGCSDKDVRELRAIFAAQPAAPAAQGDAEDAARLDFMIEHRAYVVSDPDACPGYWLHFVHKETGHTWVQGDEHTTPRAAIDAARAAKEGAKHG